MNRFLAEVLDHVNECNIDISMYIDNGLFSYAKLFVCQELIQTTLFNWVYKKYLGNYPSKMTIIRTCSTMPDILNTLKISGNGDVKAFEEFKQQITSDPVFLKAQIWEKLNARGLTTKSEYDAHATLFSQYNTHYDYNRDHMVIRSKEMLRANPITHHLIHVGGHVPNLITLKDALLHAIFVDKAFLRHINNILVVLDADGAVGIIKALKPNKYKIISSVPLPEAHYVCPSILDYLALDIFPAVVYTTRSVSLPNRCKIITVPDIAQELFEWLPANDVVQSLYSPKNMPMYITEHIYRYFIESECFKKPAIGKTPNCLLIVDSRPNMMSALSVMITRTNVPWNVLICTKPSSESYYKKLLGDDVKFMTHPLLNIDRDFEIEDYNLIMKDTLFWKEIKQIGYNTALVIQDDGMIFKKGIETFLQYDYVAAPWPEQYFMKEVGITNPVGNGGLSLRNIDAMIQITDKEREAKQMLYFHNSMIIPEDVYFAKFANTPSVDIAKSFAFEMMYCPSAIGFHKPWPYMPRTSIDEYFKQLRNMA